MNMEDKTIVEKVMSRHAALKTDVSSFMSHWREITQFISPRSARYLRGENRGGKAHQDIINETGTIASRTLQSGLMAGMSSPARPWFVLGPPDPGMKEFGPVKEWLDTVTRLMREVFTRSNIYSVLPMAYSNLGDYGTGAFGILEDDLEVIRAYPFPIGSYVLDQNDRMNVDTLIRETSMSVRQLVEKFGKENCSIATQGLWDSGSYSVMIPVVHSMEPNFAAMPGKYNSKDKPFLSCYYEEGGDKGKALRISGFDDFPALAPRWTVNGEDVYGTSCPGMLALGSVKALQLEERRKYQGIDKLINPAMNIDATARNNGVDLLPGGVNYIPGLAQGMNAGARPVYEINPHVEALMADIEKVEYRIKRCYFEDLMLMLATSDNSQMTAREVEERHQEKLLVLGPMMEQSNDDLFDPLIDRTFNIMLRRGLFPKPPEELQNKPLRVEYISIMAQAQKLIGVASVERFVGFVGSMIEAFPEVRHKVDALQIVDEYGEMVGVSSKIIVPDDVVQKKLAQEAQAAQAQKMMEAAPAMAQGASAVQSLGDTNVDGVRDMARLITGGGGA
jgi:hypothetical protein